MSHYSSISEKICNYIKENEVEFVDFRFTDMNGKWYTISYYAKAVTLSLLNEGISIDGSSVKGWSNIERADLLLLPDYIFSQDPFVSYKSIIVICRVVDPDTNKNYEKDPRFTAQKAEKYLLNFGIANKAFFGPEPEFFLFDEVSYNIDSYNNFFSIKSKEFDFGYKFGHVMNKKNGYCASYPSDKSRDIRADILDVLSNMNIGVEKHHHEVGAAQHEIGIKYSTLLDIADKIQVFKYAISGTAIAHEKVAVFMPKPIFGEAGSGMHLHQSLWLDDEPVFASTKERELSETALYYIGGVLKHAKAIAAFTNPSENSYKRLVSGYEAPVFLSYSRNNRSAACRIPDFRNKNASRVEFRFPDPSMNPYLGLSAILMAGIDGIKNKILPPSETYDNLFKTYDQNYDRLPHSLQNALEALETDHEFLLKGDVFNKELIDAYINLKKDEIALVSKQPSPMDYANYFSNL